MEMCRVCVSPEKEMLPLDESFVNNYNLLTNLNITLLDGMPQIICQTCSDTVKSFIDFREKCIASEKTLRDIVTERIKTEWDKEADYKEGKKEAIKLEIKQEYEDSNVPHHFNVCYDDFDEELQELIINKHEDDLKPRRHRPKLNKNSNKKKKMKTEKVIDFVRKFTCGICPESFDDSNKLNNHLDLHNNDRKCGLCNDLFNSRPQILAHRLVHVPIGQHKCHLCGKRFKSPLYFEHHLRNVHIDNESKRLSCKYCERAFEKPKRLLQHVQHMHSDVEYVCDVCSLGFHCKSNLRSHIKKHSDNKAYVCDMCGFSCKYSSGLKDHKIRKHAPTKMYCKNCTRPFVSQEDHDRHNCNPRYAICPICGKVISGKARLSRHLESHSDNLKYECKRCPAKYKTKGALTAHTDRHDDNRTKQCEYCHAKFFTTSVLIKHRRVHTGEKPYVCKVCNKGFTGNYNLKVHMKVHREYLIVKNRKNIEQEDLTNVTK